MSSLFRQDVAHHVECVFRVPRLILRLLLAIRTFAVSLGHHALLIGPKRPCWIRSLLLLRALFGTCSCTFCHLLPICPPPRNSHCCNCHVSCFSCLGPCSLCCCVLEMITVVGCWAPDRSRSLDESTSCLLYTSPSPRD